MNYFEDRLLTKIIKDGKMPKNINSSHFGDRKSLMEYIEQFYKDYGSVPSLEAVKENFEFETQKALDPFEYYEDKVLNESNKRKIAQQMTKMLDSVQENDLETTADLAFSLYKGYTRNSNSVSYSDLDYVDEQYDPARGEGGKSWTLLDMPSIHQNITSFSAGEFHVLAGRPKQGKTYITLSMVMDLFKQGARVGIASAEMSRDEMIQRCDMLLTGLSPDYFENGKIPTNFRRLIKRKRKEALSAGGCLEFIGFESDNDLYTGTVWDLARDIKDYDLDVLLIDSLYAYNTKAKRHSTWENTVEIVKDAVSLTRQFNVLTFVTTQLNRDAVKKKGSPSSENVSFSDSFLMFCDSLSSVSSDPTMQQAGLRNLSVLDVRRGTPGERVISFKFSPNLEIKDLESEEIEDEREIEEEENYYDYC